jgi:hypothetical protein
VKIVFSFLNLLMNDNHYLCDTSFFWITCVCIMFVGNISVKPSRDFTRPLGMPRGLKGLLHVLNATVFPTTKEVE